MIRVESGFTLIELLVSAVLLAAVSAGVAMVMSVCLSAWQAGQARSNYAQQAEAVLDTAGRDLRASFLGRQGYFVSRDDGNGRGYLELTTLSRRSQRLDYLAEAGQAPGENISDLTQVVYFTEPAEDGETFALYREEICPPQPEALDEQNLDPEAAQLLNAIIILTFKRQVPHDKAIEIIALETKKSIQFVLDKEIIAVRRVMDAIESSKILQLA